MLQRLKNFLLRPIASQSVDALYRSCVAQARQPSFYANLHIPDSVDGRFDLIVLHVFLTIQRLRDHGDCTQQLFDIMFADMDKSLREMGVSDMSIAKKMKPMLAAFYGRAAAYESALASDDTALSEAIRRNLFGTHVTPSVTDITEMTSYVRRAFTSLAAQNTDLLLNGTISFPSIQIVT